MRNFNINIYNKLIRGEWKNFLLSKVFTLGTDSFQKNALAWTDLGWPRDPAGFCGGSDEILPCLTFEYGSEPAASSVFQSELLSLAKQCDLPVRKVEKWFRRRRNMDRPCLTKKFSEAWWAGAQAMNSGFHRSWAPQTAHCLPLPSIPMQRDPSSLSALHPYAESTLGLPCPTWLCCSSLLILCYRNISCFPPLFAIPNLLLLLNLYSLLGPCFWLLLTLSDWHPALTHIWTWKTLPFISYCFAAASAPTKKACFLLPFP